MVFCKCVGKSPNFLGQIVKELKKRMKVPEEEMYRQSMLYTIKFQYQVYRKFNYRSYRGHTYKMYSKFVTYSLCVKEGTGGQFKTIN